MATIKKQSDGRYRVRYRGPDRKEHSRRFKLKKDAEAWLIQQGATVQSGTWVSPMTAKTTVGEWCERWLDAYGTRKKSTVAQARMHVNLIVKKFGNRTLASVKASDVKSWMVELKAQYADSYVYAVHSRLAQIYTDAIHDDIVAKSPVSRRTSPGEAKQRPYVATTEQVWALHDALPSHFRPVVLLGAFAGLRVAEIAALRVEHVDFMRGVITPTVQYPNEPLKTETSKTPIPIPHELTLELARVPKKWGSDHLVVGVLGRPVAPYTIEEAWRKARETIEGLPEGFRIHDLRHYFASLLISEGLDIKTVQARLRHASAKTTLDVYGHMWPDKDDSARSVVARVLTDRAENAGQKRANGPEAQ